MLMIPLLIFVLLSCELWELLALAAAILVHECGHLWALRFCGVSPDRFRVGMTGPVIDCHGLSTVWEEVLVAMAGSLFGLLWAFALSFLPLPYAPYAAEVSAVLSVFNLLPIPLLDGGRILLALGGSEKLLRICGLLCVLALLLLCAHLHLWYSCPVLLWLGLECVI